MKKLALAALIALAATSAQSAVIITFASNDGSGFAGSLTIDTAALGANMVAAPNTFYRNASGLMSVTINGITLGGTPNAGVIYSNASDTTLASNDPDYSYGASFSQQNDDGMNGGAYFYLYNDGAGVGSASFDGALLPNVVGLPNFYVTFVQGNRSFNGSVNVTSETATGSAAVPEPASWAMMVAGFGLIGGAMRRRQTGIVTA